MIAGIFRSISAATLLLLVLLSPIGCGSGFKWEGTWQGNRGLSVPPGANKALYHTLGDVKVTIKSGQFTMRLESIPVTGSVRYEGEKAFLKIETRFGQRMDREAIEVQQANKELELTAQKDGTISFVDPGGHFPEPVVLKRLKEESSGSL